MDLYGSDGEIERGLTSDLAGWVSGITVQWRPMVEDLDNQHVLTRQPNFENSRNWKNDLQPGGKPVHR